MNIILWHAPFLLEAQKHDLWKPSIPKHLDLVLNWVGRGGGGGGLRVDMISLEDTQLNIFAKRIKKWGTRKFWTCTKYLEFAQHPISPILVPHLCTPQTHSICPQLWSINFTWNCQLIPPIPTRPRPLVAPHRNFTQNMSNKNSYGPHNLKLIYAGCHVHWNHCMCTLLIISTSRCSLRSIVPKCRRKPSPEPQISLFCLKFCTIPFSTSESCLTQS